jgi:2-polyprenyl-3-methyl-5-hydroxy-6-metoxy-1,4-benzoquinol methylase
VTRPYWQLEGYSFARCAGCSHIYQNPRPRPTDLANRYDEAYKQYEVENAENFFNLMRLGLADLGFDEIEASLPVGRRFIDIGCATGVLVRHMADRAWESVGVELCEGSAEYGRRQRGVDIRTGTLDQAAFPDAHFDLVHSSHVIEHIPEPGVFVEEIRRVLKPGGWCVTVTPSVAGLQARLLGRHWRSAIADHVHLFSPNGLSRLFAERGLEPVRLKTWGGIAKGLAPAPIKTVVDRLATRYGFGDVMALLVRG